MRNILDMVNESVARAKDPRFGSGGFNIILATNAESSARNAEESSSRYGAGADMTLPGVSIAVKDNIATLDMPTTCGSRILAGYTSPYEATAVTRLRKHGAVVVAKTNMDEFAKEVYAFCPDSVEQGVGDLKSLKEYIEKEKGIWLWWD